MKTRPRPRTPRTREGEVELIEIRLERLDELFESLDPAPLASRDISVHAADRLLAELEEIGPERQPKIVLHVPQADVRRAADLESAIRAHFGWSAEIDRREVQRTVRHGWRSTALAVLLVGILIGFSQLLLHLHASRLLETVAESVVIIAWVVLWRPTELLLFEWRPIRRRQRLCERLAGLPIEVRAWAGSDDRRA